MVRAQQLVDAIARDRGLRTDRFQPRDGEIDAIGSGIGE